MLVKHLWSGPLLAVLLFGGCFRPEALPLPPQPERALEALWDLNGQPWGVGLTPPAAFLSLEDPYEVEVAYFGCDQQELAGTPAGERGCRPKTQVGYRLSDREPTWAPITPPEALAGCECADRDPYVLRQSGPLIDDTDIAKLAGATTIAGDGPLPDVLLAVIEQTRTVYYRVHGQERRSPEGALVSATLVSTATIAGQGGALWAESDGTIWSAGRAGLYRGDGRVDPVVWERIPFAAARTQYVGDLQVRLVPISMDPLRLLMVEAGGLTLLWDRSGVVELQPNRGLDGQQIRGDRADIAPFYERGELKGWVLLGPAEPLLPANDDWQNAAYVIYRDGALGPELPLPRVQVVAGSQELGTFGIDSTGGIFSLSEAGPTPRELGVSFATPKVFRIFDGHFVLSREEAPVVHYQRLELGCTGRGNDLGEVLHIFPMGDLLVEVGFLGQVRWSRARSVCNLRSP